MLVLLVEDNREFAANIIDYLALKNIECDYAQTANSAREAVKSSSFDAILLDLNLPDGDGVELCKEWQSGFLTTPVIMITARSELEHRLDGFTAGADDYLVKPFDLKELEARLLAVTRRNISRNLMINDLLIDFSEQNVYRQGKLLTLTRIDWLIVSKLAIEHPAIVTREELERYIWPNGLPNSDTLRSHLYLLRKVVDKPFDKPVIKTYRGRGYGLVGEGQ